MIFRSKETEESGMEKNTGEREKEISASALAFPLFRADIHTQQHDALSRSPSSSLMRYMYTMTISREREREAERSATAKEEEVCGNEK